MSNKEVFYNTSSKIGQLVEEVSKKDSSLKINSHFNGFRSFFTNKIALHINYTNFNLISNFFEDKRNKKLKILNLGAGFGDKTVILKSFFKNSEVYGVETIVNDDPDHAKNPPYLDFKLVYPYFRKNFQVNLDLYNGYDLEFEDNFFDIVVIYAVIEHIAPENRKKFIEKISKKLKKNGYIVITRCPRKYSLTEYLAKKMNFVTHPWRLSKDDLLQSFDSNEYEKIVLKSISNIPSNPVDIMNKFSFILIPIDYVLQLIHWPFSSDYFLIEKKIK